MTVKIETIRDLLDQQQWETCVNLADRALAGGAWSTVERAFLNLAKCRSLSNLENYSAALEPGQLAAYLAEEAKEFDLLGRSLLEVAWVQHKIPGMERWAPTTQRKFLQFFEHYKTIRAQYLPSQLNLGVYLRAAGEYAEALNQFKRTYAEARQRGEHRLAHLARSYGVWEALRLERLAEAEELINEGEAYRSDDTRLNASHLLDVAQLALLKGTTARACDCALQAAVLCGQHPDLLARALEIIQRVADREGDGDLAVIASVMAKIHAEADDRYDIMAQVSGAARSLALRYPEAVERLMATIDGVK